MKRQSVTKTYATPFLDGRVWTAHLDSSVSAAFLWRKIASASTIKILATQLRKAPSYSKPGGFRETTIEQHVKQRNIPQRGKASPIR
ncbi:MAG TPA: hypothetical protein VHZ55_08915 [Bryobacteraceae bacterium]|nr:hypothetical protein [Bryobacteraceae bacterium]